jgi:hypothetical protein
VCTRPEKAEGEAREGEGETRWAGDEAGWTLWGDREEGGGRREGDGGESVGRR